VIVRSRNRLSGWLDFMMFFPHMLSGLVIGLAILLTYLLLPVAIYGTIWILIIGFIVKNMPLSSRFTTPGMAQVHVSLEDAAEVSGAKLRHVWRKVILPLQTGVAGNALLLIFMITIQNLSLPLLLVSPGVEMLAVEIYNRWNVGLTREVAVLSLVMTAMVVLVSIVMRSSGDDRGNSR
jgi:iron(III) transport system permease protein